MLNVLLAQLTRLSHMCADFDVSCARSRVIYEGQLCYSAAVSFQAKSNPPPPTSSTSSLSTRNMPGSSKADAILIECWGK